MRILIYGINYYPELTGIGKYTGEMAVWLANQGYDVNVITAMPYYPEWNIHTEYKGRCWHKEFKDGVKIYRCPIYVPQKINSRKRIIHEFSFLLSSLFRWVAALFKKRYDLIICINPPFHIGIFPYLYSKLKATILVTHIQDLQIDAAKGLNMLEEGKFLKIMFKIEQFFLEHSDYVSTLTNGMKQRILQKGIPEKKIVMLPNWVDINKLNILGKEASLRKKFDIPLDDIVILYSGNIGKKQGLDILIDVAEDYKDYTNIHFLIVGSGVELNNLKDLVKTKKLTNIQFHPLQPYDLLPALLATADLHLVLQKKGASDLVMPSKLTGILAAGGCPIVSAEKYSSLYSEVNDNQIGIVCEPESKTSLKEAIDKALKDDISRIRLKARKYAENNLGQENIMNSFFEQINLIKIEEKRK